MNLRLHVSFQVSFFPDICLGVRLLNHRATLFLAFYGTPILFSIVAEPTYIPTNSVGGIPFLTNFSAFVIRILFDVGHSDLCEVISQ